MRKCSAAVICDALQQIAATLLIFPYQLLSRDSLSIANDILKLFRIVVKNIEPININSIVWLRVEYYTGRVSQSGIANRETAVEIHKMLQDIGTLSDDVCRIRYHICTS